MAIAGPCSSSPIAPSFPVDARLQAQKPSVLLQDVCGLEAEEAVEVSRWAAQALLKAGLREAAASS